MGRNQKELNINVKKYFNHIVEDYKNNIQPVKICKKYNISSATLYRCLRKSNYNKRHHHLIFKKDESKIVEEYIQKNKVVNIAEKYQCSDATIYRIIKKYIKIPRRKYNLIENYFENINTEEKAYILGFIFADGYISYKDRYVRIGVSEQDIDILYKIRKEIYPNNDKPLLLAKKATETIICGNKTKTQNFWCLDIHSVRILEDLLKIKFR